MMSVPWDIATMDFEQSEVIPVDSVRVQVCVTASATPEEAHGIVAAVRHTLSELTRTEWEILGIRQGEDSVGMLRMRVHATARIPAEELAGLTTKLKTSSRSGFRVELVGTRFRAPASVRRASIDRTRLRLYEHVNEQIRILNEAFPEPSRPWRLAEISVSTHEGEDSKNEQLAFEKMITPQMTRLRYPNGAGDEEREEEPGVVRMTNRVTLKAKVTIRRPALNIPEGGASPAAR